MNFFQLFRTSHPRFEPGDTLRVVMTDFDREQQEGIARIGDTILRIDGAERNDLDEEIEVKVEQFNAEESMGRAKIVDNQ